MEERLIFHPDNVIHQTPGNVGLIFDDVHFTARDGVRLNGWYIPHTGAQRTLLWFHGNAGNISHRVQNIKLLHDNLRINVFIFDYRGYGRSEGKISETGTYLDGSAAIDYLRGQYQVPPGQMVLFGRSLGAAVAAEMATQVESLILILESPFVSVPEMARTIFPLLPLRSLLSTQYNTLEKVQHVKSPLLILHGDQDEVVPYSQGRKVFEAANEPKRFYTIPGASHNDTYLAGGDPYFAALRDGIEWAAAWRTK
ncbi:MAG: alpha/beta hydrolase [Candidatus Binatia bacterium]